MGHTFISEIVKFVQEILKGLGNGLFLFGGPLDILRYVADILIITFVTYKMIRLLKETRAWQLLRGMILIVLFTMVCSLLGLEMVTFLFDNLLYIVAIAFVVIFQPELRRTLEAIGLKSFSSLSSAMSTDEQTPQGNLSRMIDEVVAACVKMGKQYTGALIIFERNSRLGELIEQENAVQLDSAVSDTMLQSIFYKGSPLHDGAILIRDGRIAAARCHIPLADNLHMREDLGTRHRAAIGASEMGDAIAVAVSEERGTISIAIDGVLRTIQSGQDLRQNLRYLLGVTETASTLGQRIKSRYSFMNRKKKDKSKHSTLDTQLPVTQIDAFGDNAESGHTNKVEPSSEYYQNLVAENPPKDSKTPRINSSAPTRMTKSQRLLYFVMSLLISIGLWTYIQITTNPVTSKILTVAVQTTNSEHLTSLGLAPEYPVTTVTVNVVGRKNQISSLTVADMKAYIDFSNIAKEGVVDLPIHVNLAVSEYFRIDSQNPEILPVNIFQDS